MFGWRGHSFVSLTTCSHCIEPSCRPQCSNLNRSTWDRPLVKFSYLFGTSRTNPRGPFSNCHPPSENSEYRGSRSVGLSNTCSNHLAMIAEFSVFVQAYYWGCATQITVDRKWKGIIGCIPIIACSLRVLCSSWFRRRNLSFMHTHVFRLISDKL